MYIIVGLGNPGREYNDTRHNVGFMVLDRLAAKLNISVSKKGFRSIYGEGRVGSEKLVLAKPNTYMNNSGWAVMELMSWYKISPDRLIVVYDDIDIPCGTLRIRANGSAGTHNGMRSIVEQLGFDDFPRIRIGIGKPMHGLIDHVLGVPSDDDKAALSKGFDNAVKAIMLITEGKFDAAQAEYNYKPSKPQKQTQTRPQKLPYSPISDVSEISNAKEIFFANENVRTKSHADTFTYNTDDILDAEARLKRFAPLIKKVFPETEDADGIIESPLTEVKTLRRALQGNAPCGRLFIKRDSELPIAGSVKARGGIYEILKYTEELATSNGLIHCGDDYAKLDQYRDFFNKYAIHVGSTGNLGLSIGIASAAIGYRVTVHMSVDAKQWKKDMLRSNGVNVIEYASDYQEAVRQGRLLSQADESSYFVDDENSVDLFMGYAVAAFRLKKQLAEQKVTIDDKHPLFVYLPCGVGGAPGGITFGLKQLFGQNVHCFFVEPVNAPCMLAAFYKDDCIPVSTLGLSGKTDADGLAVSCASKLVYAAMKSQLDGEFTVSDNRLIPYLRLVHGTEGIFIEPSAASALAGAEGMNSPAGQEYIKKHCPNIPRENITEILWATGGRLVPDDDRRKLLKARL